MYLGVPVTLDHLSQLTGCQEIALMRDQFRSQNLDIFDVLIDSNKSEDDVFLVGIRIVIDEADTKTLLLKKDQVLTRFKKMKITKEFYENAIVQFDPQKVI